MTENLKEIVREKYGAAALRATAGEGSSCCGSSSCCDSTSVDPITSNLYDTIGATGIDAETAARETEGRFMSAFIRAKRPL